MPGRAEASQSAAMTAAASAAYIESRTGRTLSRSGRNFVWPARLIVWWPSGVGSGTIPCPSTVSSGPSER